MEENAPELNVEIAELRTQYEQEVSERNAMNRLHNELARAMPTALVFLLTKATAKIAALEAELEALQVTHKATIITQSDTACRLEQVREHFDSCTKNKNEQLQTVSSLTPAV